MIGNGGRFYQTSLLAFSPLPFFPLWNILQENISLAHCIVIIIF